MSEDKRCPECGGRKLVGALVQIHKSRNPRLLFVPEVLGKEKSLFID